MTWGQVRWLILLSFDLILNLFDFVSIDIDFVAEEEVI